MDTAIKDSTGGLAAGVGSISVLVAAGLTSGFRDEIGTANVALLLAGIVVVAALASRFAGVMTALIAATAFNFFHTAPYHSLRIHAARDMVTVLLLCLMGVIVGEMNAWRRRTHAASARRLHGAAALEQAAADLAARCGPDEMWSLVRPALIDGLHLADCTYEPGSTPRTETLPHSGGLVGRSMHFGHGGFKFPTEGVSIPVVYAGETFGHIVLVQDEPYGSTIDDRRVAVTLADQFAVACALARSPTPAPA